jgi:hypothetical protein
MSHHQIGKRRTGIHYEYDGDGRFDQERWDESDKRYWKRWLRRVGKEELEEAVNDHVQDAGTRIDPNHQFLGTLQEAPLHVYRQEGD